MVLITEFTQDLKSFFCVTPCSLWLFRFANPKTSAKFEEKYLLLQREFLTEDVAGIAEVSIDFVKKTGKR